MGKDGKADTYYLVRDEIETVVKEKGISRQRFHEFSKTGWQDIINRFYYTFIDHKCLRRKELAYAWRLHFRQGLEHSEPVIYSGDSYFEEVMELIPAEDRDKKLFLILSEGWVYEGYAREIFDILPELFYPEDAYILSPRFCWVICHCGDGESAVLYRA